jgi:hypothetical protein
MMRALASGPASGGLVLVLAVSLALRLALLALPVGFLTGDDVEILLAGIAPVTGPEVSAWEIRNLLLPHLLITPTAWVAHAVGVTSPPLLVRVAALPFLLLATVNIVLVHRLAHRFFDGATALVAAWVYALHWLPLAYGATVYPRTATTTCVLLATLLLTGQGREWARALGAGLWIALAFAFRYSEAIFLPPLALFGWASGSPWRRELPRAMVLGIGFVAGSVVTVGVVDLATWGKPFASLLAFARYTLVEQQASSLVAHQPVLWYLRRAGFWLLPPLLPFLFTRPRRGTSLPFWLLAAVPLVLLSAVHHKVLRYLQGILPFLAILVACGVLAWWRAGRRKTTVALLAAALLLSGLGVRRLVDDRSSAAVAAALALREEPCARRIVVRQAWAYGHALFLPEGAAVHDFDTPPTPEELRAALPGSDFALFYRRDLELHPELEAVLQAAGFSPQAEPTRGGSEPVVVFRGSSPCGSEPTAPR